MSRIEKTAFISYRRANFPLAMKLTVEPRAWRCWSLFEDLALDLAAASLR